MELSEPTIKQNLTVEKLNELSKGLTQAQVDRIQKQSLYEITKSSNVETVGIILQDPALAALRQQQTELEAQDAQLSTQFGASYPKVQEVRSRLKLIREAYNKELQNGTRPGTERLRSGLETRTDAAGSAQ